MHWADVFAEKIMQRSHNPVCATGITPSGHIHVGNMREVLSAELVCRAIEDAGGNPTFTYIGDTIDPLRKVYPFLPDSYSEYVGMPLSDIPCPCGEHKNYAEHFLEPLLNSFRDLGIKANIKLTHEMYADGKYGKGIERIIKNKDRVREILTGISGRELKKNWYPYTPRCEECGKLGAEVIGEELPYVYYRCHSCGHEGKSNIYKADGKLPWRLDWPTRWEFLGIEFEPFGKDHATKGGSYDTGKVIADEIHGYAAPEYVVYEWIQLKGKGAMASSLGNVITAEDMIKMTSPEVLRYLICRVNPERHIDFDPGMGILKLYEEYENIESNYFGERKNDNDQLRMFELSQVSSDYQHISSKGGGNVPFKHVVTISQMADDIEELQEIIERGGGNYVFDKTHKEVLYKKWISAKYWLETYAPDNVKFSILPDDSKVNVTEEETNIISTVAERLRNIVWNPDNIHSAIHNISKEMNVSSKKVFSTLYKIIIGKDRGPRLGFFLFSMGRESVIKRLESYIG